MKNRLKYLKRRNLGQGVLLIAVGVTGMLVSAFADWIGVGHPGFGTGQLFGLVIGAILTTAGLVNVILQDPRILVRFLAGIYLSGILYAGLMPDYCQSAQHNVKVLLDFHSYGLRDFAMNTVGFMPLGYLLMLSFGNRKKDLRSNLLPRAIMVAGFGSFVSLFMEMSQYYLISGRASSLCDWIFNTLGALLGAIGYLVLSRKPALQ